MDRNVTSRYLLLLLLLLESESVFTVPSLGHYNLQDVVLIYLAIKVNVVFMKKIEWKLI